MCLCSSVCRWECWSQKEVWSDTCWCIAIFWHQNVFALFTNKAHVWSHHVVLLIIGRIVSILVHRRSHKARTLPSWHKRTHCKTPHNQLNSPSVLLWAVKVIVNQHYGDDCCFRSSVSIKALTSVTDCLCRLNCDVPWSACPSAPFSRRGWETTHWLV